MNILALDASTHSTGYCVGTQDEIITYGCLTADQADARRRIISMRTMVKQIIQQYNIDYIIMEQVRPDIPNSRVYQVLTWLQGALTIMVYELNSKMPIQYIGATTWRKILGMKQGSKVKRAQSKKQDIEYVKNTFNIDANDDICDAICIYKAYLMK